MRTARQTPSNSVRIDNNITIHHYVSHITMDDEPMPFVPCKGHLTLTDMGRAEEMMSYSPHMSLDEARKVVSAQEANERALKLEKELEEERQQEEEEDKNPVAHFD